MVMSRFFVMFSIVPVSGLNFFLNFNRNLMSTFFFIIIVLCWDTVICIQIGNTFNLLLNRIAVWYFIYKSFLLSTSWGVVGWYILSDWKQKSCEKTFSVLLGYNPTSASHLSGFNVYPHVWTIPITASPIIDDETGHSLLLRFNQLDGLSSVLSILII